MITKISIHGLRGFGENKEIEFAIPNGDLGSGITYFVGQNNTGKTTILEAIDAFNCNSSNTPSFSEKKRNLNFDNGRIELMIEQDDVIYKLLTPSSGGSETLLYANEKKIEKHENYGFKSVYCLTSRRNFEQEFGKGLTDRENYLKNRHYGGITRNGRLNEFQSRLFEMWEKRIHLILC